MSTKGCGWKWSEEAKKRKSEIMVEAMNRPEVKERCRNACNRPEVKERHKKTNACPEVKKRRSEALKEVLNRPEVKKRRSEAQKIAQNRPGAKEHQSRKQKEVMSRPEVKKAVSEGLKEAYKRPGAREARSERQKEVASRSEVKKAFGEWSKGFWTDLEERRLQSEKRKRHLATLSYEEKLVLTLPGRMAVKSRSKGEIALCEYIQQFYPEAECHQFVAGYECDIVLRGLSIDIEYDGYYWHKDRKMRDDARDEFLCKLGWLVLRVKEKEPFDIETLHDLVRLRKIEATA